MDDPLRVLAQGRRLSQTTEMDPEWATLTDQLMGLLAGHPRVSALRPVAACGRAKVPETALQVWSRRLVYGWLEEFAKLDV